jgi:hypothetical protein
VGSSAGVGGGLNVGFAGGLTWASERRGRSAAGDGRIEGKGGKVFGVGGRFGKSAR